MTQKLFKHDRPVSEEYIIRHVRVIRLALTCSIIITILSCTLTVVMVLHKRPPVASIYPECFSRKDGGRLNNLDGPFSPQGNRL